MKKSRATLACLRLSNTIFLLQQPKTQKGKGDRRTIPSQVFSRSMLFESDDKFILDEGSTSQCTFELYTCPPSSQQWPWIRMVKLINRALYIHAMTLRHKKGSRASTNPCKVLFCNKQLASKILGQIQFLVK